VALSNDVILRTAMNLGLDIVDLRAISTEPADYANPIEPSLQGGLKIARAIARSVGATSSADAKLVRLWGGAEYGEAGGVCALGCAAQRGLNRRIEGPAISRPLSVLALLCRSCAAASSRRSAAASFRAATGPTPGGPAASMPSTFVSHPHRFGDTPHAALQTARNPGPFMQLRESAFVMASCLDARASRQLDGTENLRS
jgi:hypothetical protein